MTVVADERVIWHDVECGGYGADLPLWRELAEPRAVTRSSRSAAAPGGWLSTSPGGGIL